MEHENPTSAPDVTSLIFILIKDGYTVELKAEGATRLLTVSRCDYRGDISAVSCSINPANFNSGDRGLAEILEGIRTLLQS